jgi:hypothetical protein
MIKLIETEKDDSGFVSLLEIIILKVMVYVIQENQVGTWYASFLVENQKWNIKQVKGMSLEAVERLANISKNLTGEPLWEIPGLQT